MTMPNFLIIGAAKAGTTALYYYLQQHPTVFMSSIKEPNFFAWPDYRSPTAEEQRGFPIRSLSAYQDQFRGISNQTAVGEASTLYLQTPGAARRIRDQLSQAKLIAILRNPAERAYSHYMMEVREGRETLDLLSAIQSEETRLSDGAWSYGRYAQPGRYHAHLKTFLDLFDRELMGIYLYDDLQADPVHLLRRVFQFLEVDDAFVPDTSFRYNVSGRPRNRWLHHMLTKGRRMRHVLKPILPSRLRHWGMDLYTRNLERASLSAEERGELVEFFREDTMRLQDLIQRDLSAWLE